jgi:hypothetical protein
MNPTTVDRFRKALERAGAKEMSTKLARKLLEQPIHYQHNTPCIKLLRASIGSELLDKYPPSKLKELLIKAGFAYCPNSFESAQWYLAPLGIYKACWEEANNFASSGNTPKVEELAKQITTLQQEKDNTEARLIGLEMQNAQFQNELNQIKAEFGAVWAAIRHIEEHDKPITIEKIERHLKIVGGG